MPTSNVKSEFIQKHGNTIGFILIALWTFFVMYYHHSWESASQMAFHLPLIVLWWFFFRNTLSIFTLGILSWVSYLISDLVIIDDLLTELLIWIKIYPKDINPQYTKLSLYIISLIATGVMLVVRKNRTTMRCFAFLSGLGCFTVTLLIHDAIPYTTLKWERDMVKNNVSSVLEVIKEDPHLMPLMCKSFNLTCHESLDREEIVKRYGHAWDLRDFSDPKYSPNKLVFEYNRFNEGSFIRQIYGLLKRDEGRYLVVIEEEIINKSQLVSEEAFGKLNAFANFVWGQVLLLLGIFHLSERRKSLFTKTK